MKSTLPPQPMRLAVIILNYRRADLTIECLQSLAEELSGHADRCAVVIDNGSDDGSADQIESAIATHKWDRWVKFIRSPQNCGFAGGNNIGIGAVEADHYLLLNSDTRVMANSIDELLNAMEQHPHVGAVGPRLQGIDGAAQVSCYRYRTPLTELLEAAATGPLDRLFAGKLVAMGVFDEPVEAPWLSFACIMIRRAVIEQVGTLDENYFMYFEDMDYSRRMRRTGWRILHWPQARVVHLRGGSSSVKSAMKAKARVPKYYYESRSRYFAKFYGGIGGLWLTNVCWLIGRTISLVRELLGSKQRSACESEARDNWTNWSKPLRTPHTQKGGDL